MTNAFGPVIPRAAWAAIVRAARRGRYPERDAALVGLVAFGGLSLAEICDLTGADVKIEAYHDSRANQHKPHLVVRDAAGNERRVSLPTSAVKLLTAYFWRRTAKLPKRLYGTPVIDAEEPVIASEHGGPISYHRAQCILRRAATLAGYSDVGARRLRQSHAAEVFVVTGGNEARVLARLGQRRAGRLAPYLVVPGKTESGDTAPGPSEMPS